MRIWDVSPECLCRKHLLGEHRELHGIWNILTKHEGKGGYSNHPETKRWVGKLATLYTRHTLLVKELERRNYKHLSPLDKDIATGITKQNEYLNSLDEQRTLLFNKKCECPLDT